MIREAFDWILTSAWPPARKMGHVGQFVSIAARRRRNRAAWAMHEARTKAAILRACDADKSRECAVLLGAGHADDVPVAELSSAYQKLRLVDVAISLETRRLAAKLGNVECVIADVTQSLHHLPEVRQPKLMLEETEISFVASVNLLSQLPNVATRHMEDEETHPIAQAMIEAHLAWLLAFNCPVSLICDKRIEVYDRSDELVGAIDPAHGIALPPEDESWIWKIAPFGEIEKDHRVIHHVMAIDDLHNATSGENMHG